MAPTNPGSFDELLASFEAAPDKLNWLLSHHTLGAPRINLMKDRIKNLDKEYDELMEEKRRYEARFNGELDVMRSAASLPVVAKPRAGRRYARKESDYRGVCTTGGVQNPWAVRKQIPKEMREHEKDIYVEIGRFKTQQEADCKNLDFFLFFQRSFPGKQRGMGQIRADLTSISTDCQGHNGCSRTQRMVKDSTDGQGLNGCSIRILDV